MANLVIPPTTNLEDFHVACCPRSDLEIAEFLAVSRASVPVFRHRDYKRLHKHLTEKG